MLAMHALKQPGPALPWK